MKDMEKLTNKERLFMSVPVILLTLLFTWLVFRDRPENLHDYTVREFRADVRHYLCDSVRVYENGNGQFIIGYDNIHTENNPRYLRGSFYSTKQVSDTTSLEIFDMTSLKCSIKYNSVEEASRICDSLNVIYHRDLLVRQNREERRLRSLEVNPV